MNDLKLSAMHVGFCPVILWVIWHHYRCNCLLKCSLWTRHWSHLAGQPGLYWHWVQLNILQLWFRHKWLWSLWGCWCSLQYNMWVFCCVHHVILCCKCMVSMCVCVFYKNVSSQLPHSQSIFGENLETRLSSQTVWKIKSLACPCISLSVYVGN